MSEPALWSVVLGKLLSGCHLAPAEAEAAMSEILEGRATDAQIGAFAVGLRAKGETVDELVAFATTMRRYATPFPALSGPLVDTCGTGGDRSGSVNVSTMAAFVVAGAGARVAKHGNRAASSRCGSADVLEALGVVVDLPPAGVVSCIERAGLGFCFAPRFHPALRHAARARRELGVATTFNFLGPLVNPAGARRAALGVSDPAMADPLARVLGQLGTERALVFFGHDGLDELTTTTTSTILDLADGEVRASTLDPADLGLARAEPGSLVGGDPAYNAAAAQRLLDGEPGPVRDLVLLNAAAGIVVAGIAPDLASALEVARSSIDEGKAKASLDALVERSAEAARPGFGEPGVGGSP